ncbi:hypothetical protein SAMN04488544_1881 [Microlunatus sagamiharensis]|uniref:Trypsin n=1 Tax=Microlunatus sagamiharensis TaxID=546874 RepID=A0A1H2MEN2_9ACTN|nr:hypothetical protein SAMN04488544_1881 [Microlunatus sagamiharensis]
MLVAAAGPAPGASATAIAPRSSAPVGVTADAAVAALDPASQAVLLAPLRAAAAALDHAGRLLMPDAYAGVALDAAAGRTQLYLTDPALAPGLVAAARRTDPTLVGDRVTVLRAAYPLTRLDAVSRAVMTVSDVKAADAPYAAYPAPDASGVVVEVADPTDPTELAAARRADARAGGVPLEPLAGRPRQPHGWDAVKWHDHAPFIGGDVLTTDGHRYCTAGLPAVRRSDGRAVMVTAAHCFTTGQRVRTGGGATWDYGNGRTGDRVGTVMQRHRGWDAETVVGADVDGDVSDTSGWRALTGVGYSYRGDYVCHAGARSASKGHPTPCGIKVTVDDLWFREAGHTVRGVEGVDVHGWGSVGGDSGGTVFAVEPHGKRQLRGLVSSGGADGTADQRRVDWPEAVDIFRAFDLRLDPQT